MGLSYLFPKPAIRDGYEIIEEKKIGIISDLIL